ncbi:MFS transporter [Streptomyces sp. MS1.AVA.3]|uniref:MFS transporter n=1 Tax=Streptomyces decoyicus TaxID=249567 RepID=UPI0030BB74F4
MTSTLPPPSSYRQVLTTRHVGPLLAGAVIAHLPVAMAPLAILLSVRSNGGSLSTAGLLAAIYGLTAAISQPIWGRLLDRRGHRPALIIPTFGSTLGFAALLLTEPVMRPELAVMATTLAGACTQPTEAALRILWPHLLERDADQRKALAIDACAQELVFIAGPVAVLLADSAGGPSLALAATAAAGIAGSTLFLSATPASRTVHTNKGASDWIGPLRAPAPRTLVAALFGTGVALGAINVVALASAERHDTEYLSTLMPAALAVGSLTGGLVYGQRGWTSPPGTQLLVAAGGILAALVPLLADPTPGLALPAALLPGLFLAPLLIIAFQALGHLTPPAMLGEASAWLIAALGLGQAAGTALAGRAVAWGDQMPLLVALGGAAWTCGLLAPHRNEFAPPNAYRQRRRQPAKGQRDRAAQ